MIYLNALIEEIKLDLKISLSYKSNFISETITIFILYISLLYLDSGSSLGSYYGVPGDSKSLLLIGYVLWSLSIMAINIVSNNISSEATSGTLEQKFLSIVPVYLLIFAQFISALLIQVVEVLIIILVSILFFDISIGLTLTDILIAFITIVGMYGIGIIFGGISLKAKKVGKIIFIFQIGLLFLSDTISVMSDKVNIGKIIPLTLGNDLIRKSMSGAIIPTSEYLQLIITSGLWLIVGVAVFKYFEIKSKKQGLLNMY